MPIFSVIVPVYNVENQLEECIESILGQTFIDFELILVNDGSTDNSGMICDKYAQVDNRIVVIHKENGGVSSARNTGIDMAKGEYISFVDSDDYVEKNYLEELYNPDVDMVLCNIKFINIKYGNHYILQNKNNNIFNIDSKVIEELINNRYISTVYSKSYKKSIIDLNNIRFNTEISLGEDTMFVADYLVSIKNLYISDIVVYNYIDYGSESLSKFSIKKLQMLENANTYIEHTFNRIYPISTTMAFKKRMWSNYEWAIFEAIKSKDMNIFDKREVLKYVFNNKKYRDLISNIHIYMKDDSRLVRNILQIKNVTITILFFKICSFKTYLKNIKLKKELRGF